jgi:CRISPR-associated protein Csd1
MLPELCEFARRRPLDLPPTLYSERPVRYVIELSETGRLLSRLPIDTSDANHPSTRNGVRRPVPTIQRSGRKVRPLLFADNAEYSFGLARGSQEHVGERHDAYLELVNRCAEFTTDAAVRATARFLANDPGNQLGLDCDYDRGASVTFRVGGIFLVDLPTVQEFWAREHDPGRAKGSVIGHCLVCGQERPLLKRLPAKLKSVPGGRPSGTALISANEKAFESYGLDASLIAPTCGECAELFTNGLNHLLMSESQCTRLGGIAYVYWTHEEIEEFNPLTMCTQPDPDQVQSLLKSVYGRREKSPFDDSPFYALALAGSGGRTVVRDWVDTTVGEVRRSLARWFQQQRVTNRNGEAVEPVSLFALAAATVRDHRTDLSPLTPRALLRSAMAGSPLPMNLLSEAVRRNRAEQRVSHPRAALIKAVILSRQSSIAEEDNLIQLDEEKLDPGYRCGRLLAVLESTQYAALGITAVTDRFYGAASSAPASVFGRLLRGAQPHLAKLERDRPGAHHALQRRIESILSGLDGFPKTLGMEDQGLFALGYYHQRAHDHAEARARRNPSDGDSTNLNTDGELE